MNRRASTREPWYQAVRGAPVDAHRAMPAIDAAVLASLRRHGRRALLLDEARQLPGNAVADAIERRARQLRQRTGAGDATVAVRMRNDLELAITYFACLRAGLRYLPLSPAPVEVIESLLASLAPRLLIGDVGDGTLTTGGIETLTPADVDRLVADPPGRPDVTALPPPDPLRPAHVLLTSGTETGSPRAVLTDHVGSMLSHRWRGRLWPYDPARDVVGCNIFGIWDVVPALLHGVPVVMLDDATVRDPLALAAAVVRYGITRLMLTPTLLDACLESAPAATALTRLRLMVLCGEPVTAALTDRVWRRLPGVTVANLYSLSECHDVASAVLRPGGPLEVGPVAPFADVHVVQPDDRRRLAAVGEPGRILVSGSGLARGYLDPAHTARRFFAWAADDAAEPLRVYDTGDLGRLHDDGSLEILGRAEQAMKVRGAWTEPDAVTARLLALPWVTRAVVVADTGEQGHPALAAFVVPAADAPPDLARQLRARLAQSLPPQSVPARIELCGDLPLLPSGKIDRSRLRAAGTEDPLRRAAIRNDRAAGPGSLEHSVLAAFRDVLQQPSADPADPFDALGGDSLTAIVLCSRIHAFTGKLVRVRDLLRYPSAAELARHLAAGPARAAPERFPMPMDRLPAPSHRPPRPLRTLFVTGATGSLGAALLERLLKRTGLNVIALVRADDVGHARTRLWSTLPDDTPLTNLTALAGDLTRPRLGLGATAFADLGRRVDAVLHMAARVDMFAGFEALAAVNVAGTRNVLDLALSAGASFHHLSSSSVLPLGSAEPWDESRYGRPLLDALTPRLLHSDGYSQSKLAAEALVWQAAERGLPVTVIRLPHLAAAGRRSRLVDTLASLDRLGVLPEGPWQWQIADIPSVCERLLHRLQTPIHRPLLHLAPLPVSDSDLEVAIARRGRPLPRLTLPALANVVIDAANRPSPHWDRRQTANVVALAQLTREYGVRAALCLEEPVLVSRWPLAADPVDLLLDSLPD